MEGLRSCEPNQERFDDLDEVFIFHGLVLEGVLVLGVLIFSLEQTVEPSESWIELGDIWYL